MKTLVLVFVLAITCSAPAFTERRAPAADGEWELDYQFWLYDGPHNGPCYWMRFHLKSNPKEIEEDIFGDCVT